MYYHKTDRDEGIKYLAEKYPKCFFEDPHQRRPLKHNIVMDLEKENVLNHEALLQVIDWYTSHFAYRYALVAGAERVNLDGAKAGTVTPQEHVEAKAWIAARKKELGERPRSNGSEAPPRPAVVIKVAVPPTHPMLADTQTALVLVNSFLTEPQYEPMRRALVTTALKELVVKVEGLIEQAQQLT